MPTAVNYYLNLTLKESKIILVVRLMVMKNLNLDESLPSHKQ